MTKNTITSISFHRKIQLEDSDIHLLKKQLFAPFFYLVTTPSTCCMVDAGQPLGSDLSYHVCTCKMDDSVTNIFKHLRSHNTVLVLN